ncbi:unnamed protein product [Nesidiocoris tenuis]|uniref:Uncharacterized protein n=1 Tax=Nesidiocoris tenuis TaxID=355587 RepID=A0A6H5GBU4_9HEMI|nr:unnamed protein product [Nesidiocoris tenuis]
MLSLPQSYFSSIYCKKKRVGFATIGSDCLMRRSSLRHPGAMRHAWRINYSSPEAFITFEHAKEMRPILLSRRGPRSHPYLLSD